MVSIRLDYTKTTDQCVHKELNEENEIPILDKAKTCVWRLKYFGIYYLLFFKYCGLGYYNKYHFNKKFSLLA